jgi:hypothetical protein
MKNKDQKSFVIYTEYRELIELLSIADRGRLFTAMMEYCTTGEVSIKLGGTVLAVFISIRQSLDRDAEKYRKRCEMNRESGKLGGRPRKSESTDAITDGNCTKETEDETLRGDDEHIEAACEEAEMEYCDGGETADADLTSRDTDSDECCPEDVIERNFERFWEAYPKKTHRSDARLTWAKMKPNNALTKRMIDAIEIQQHSDKWCNDNGRYIPSANRWLNTQGWINELDPHELIQAERRCTTAKAMEMAWNRSMCDAEA